VAELTRPRLATLAAELRAELPRIDRTVEDLALARPTRGPDGRDAAADTPGATRRDPHDDRLRRYATAAVLDTFYTAIERVLERIARAFATLPSGPAWHADLLAQSAVDVRGVRPAVLDPGTASELRRFLGFRHRFRHLYLFDLQEDAMHPLCDEAPAVWAAARAQLEAFASQLDEIARQLEP
jgi:hypothetical protein